MPTDNNAIQIMVRVLMKGPPPMISLNIRRKYNGDRDSADWYAVSDD